MTEVERLKETVKTLAYLVNQYASDWMDAEEMRRNNLALQKEVDALRAKLDAAEIKLRRKESK